MQQNEFPRFQEPETDYFELEQWNGAEIYRGEEYLHMQHNGDIVLDDMETIVEWAKEHAVLMTAERG